MSTVSVDQLIAQALTLAQTSPLGLAVRHGPIFNWFSCHPIVSNLDTGMWGEVNNQMDITYGADVPEKEFQENLKGGKYGLECVLTCLSRAHKHTTWQPGHDGLLSIKLQRIIDGLISMSISFIIFLLSNSNYQILSGWCANGFQEGDWD